ncbi:hypothetical protein FRC15_011162 [Serendipita sp. 397]|nr:hypothetical protein FRC15_011162 [Serendipita sp. 397]
MSQRRGRNNITGPTSALTSFLREHGITARTSVFAQRTNITDSQDEPRDEDGEDAEDQIEGPSQPHERGAEEYASDNLDDSEEPNPPKKKRKLTKAVEEKLKAKERAKMEKKTGRKSMPDDDDADDDDEDDPYKAKSKGVMAQALESSVPIGTFQNCATCGKKFTVTKYTVSNDSGLLCHTCAKASGADPFKRQAAPRKRKPAAKRVVQNFEEVEAVRPLTGMCINIISKYIDHVDELGDIGAVNMDRICKIVSKTRNLTEENVRLFYGVSNHSLVIYDSTNLQPDTFETMAYLNPNLEQLALHMCGRMESRVLGHWAQQSQLQHIKRIELLGPFLVREEAWKLFLREKGPQLTGFLITNAPRFTRECLDILVENASQLQELRLAEVNQIEDSWLEPIAQLTSLNNLDLASDLSGRKSLSSAAVIDLLKAIGGNLALLNLNGHEDLEDDALTEGIAGNCQRLEELYLRLLPMITDAGVATLFKDLPRTNRLTRIDMSRCHGLSSLALTALLDHSGATLTFLGINSWKDADEMALNGIGEKAKKLVELDIGWCRNVNDLVIGSLLKPKKGRTQLKTLSCFGCNRITNDCPRQVRSDNDT